MAIKNINGIHDKSLVVSTSGNTYNIGDNAIIVASGYINTDDAVGAIYERDTVAPIGRNTFNIDGRIVGYYKGIETFGSHDHITIGAHGEVSGYDAVLLHGDETTLINRGNVVSASGDGINYSGSNFQIHNYGSVKGYYGILGETADGVTITNEAGGRIYGTSVGVQFSGSLGMSATFINHGIVRVGDRHLACFGLYENDTVINDGILNGAVALDDGQDTIDTRGGVINGSIVGGNGDDTLITDRANYTLVEEVDGGKDTVKSTVNYTLTDNIEILKLLGKADIDGTGNNGSDSLIGNAANNRLSGGAGSDALFGGKGDDVMTGGADDDIFHFATGGGHDTITDLTQMLDQVDLSHWVAVDSFTQVMDHAHDQNNGVLIKAGHDSLFIQGLSKAELTGGDFLFVA